MIVVAGTAAGTSKSGARVIAVGPAAAKQVKVIICHAKIFRFSNQFFFVAQLISIIM